MKNKETELTNSVEGPLPEPNLSLCMIVRNEARHLRGCLESIRDYVDEIVIVDTGSTDGTVEIARSYTDDVFLHPWEDSFSKARNQSLEHATGDWVFIMDADEELAAGSGPFLREAIRDTEEEAFLVHVENVFNHGSSKAAVNQVRLFRNRRSVRYAGIVHNRLEGCRWSRALPVRIHHDGYDLDPEVMARKFERTTSLLSRQVARTPTDPMPHHYLCVSYLGNSMYSEAAEEGRCAIDLAEQQKNGDLLYVWTHFMTGAALLNLRDLAGTEEYALRGLKKYRDNLDCYYLLTRVYYERKNWPDFLEAAANYLRVQDRVRSHPEDFDTLVIVTAHDEWRVRVYLGAAYWEMGNSEKAQEQYTLAVEASNGSAACFQSIGSYHFRRGEWELARKYTDLSLEKRPEDPGILYAKTKLCGIEGDADGERDYRNRLLQVPLKSTNAPLFAQLGTRELREGNHRLALSLLEKARELSPEDPEVLINLGLALKKSGRTEDALGCYEKAVEIDPEKIEGLVNLGQLHAETGDPGKARTYLSRALDLGEEAVDVHLGLARIAVGERAIEETVAHCDAVLRILGLPRNRVLDSCDELSELFGQIGDVLIQRGEGGCARLAFEVAVALHSAPATTARKAAELFLRRGDSRTAVTFLESAVRSEPEEPESFELLGECYSKLRVPEAAALCFARARELAGHVPRC